MLPLIVQKGFPPIRSQFRVGTAALLAAFLTVWGLLPAFCQSAYEVTREPPVAETQMEPAGIRAEFGFSDVWKLGHICPVRVYLDEALNRSATALEIVSVDGDGVEVVYRQPLSPLVDGSDQARFASIRIGRQAANVVVRALEGERLLAAREFDIDTVSTPLASSQPLIVAIGDTMGVEALSRQTADGSASNFSTALVQNAASLPIDWRAYGGVDLVLLSVADLQLVDAVSQDQWNALDTYIRRGGGCIISLGEQAESLPSNSFIPQLLPGSFLNAATISNPGPLESLVATEDPLRSFGCSRLEIERGRVELMLSDSLSRSVPWWVSYAHGHGTMRFVASDLGAQAFDDWDDRKLLWRRLLSPYMEQSTIETSEEARSADSNYLGYDDLVGQLRATLDLFPGVQVVAFGQITVILIAILVLIGPLDYFVSVKWLKRPDLSWVIAGALLIGASVGLTLLYAAIRPSEVLVNSVQVVDIDTSTSDMGGRMWSHVYSGAARRLDVSVETELFDSPIRVDWQGLPGRGLGGLLSQLNADRGMPRYSIQTNTAGETRIEGVGIPSAGTKCLQATWTGKVELVAESELKEIPGVDQLEGQLANPLPYDLLDPVLYYHNWSYSLDSRIPAGRSVTISFDTIPKDLSRRLNGRRTVDGNETITKWDPSDRNSIDRLLELMMFHKAAAGKTYTSLNHRYQPQIDQSNLLQTDRAILLGRLEEPWASVNVSAADNSSADQDTNFAAKQNLNRVWCRIAIPVQQNTRK